MFLNENDESIIKTKAYLEKSEKIVSSSLDLALGLLGDPLLDIQNMNFDDLEF